jgi:putative chitinase
MPVIVHTVKSGETLSSIARQYGVPLSELRESNPEITNPHRIYVGQTIMVMQPDPSPHAPSIQLQTHQLKEIVPTLTEAQAQALITPLTYALRMAEASTIERQAAMLAQVAHETGGLRHMRELGREGYFTRYDGRKDLGNIHPGDGAKFRGRGFIQLTGRANYQRCSQALGIDVVEQPELVETYGVAAMVLAWYWNEHHLNQYADTGNFVGLTKRINGGVHGLEDRQRYYQRALEALQN